jgi:CheY-like chemotaxis protein
MKILVVDDHAETASALAASLREATNCEVFAAAGGQQALETTQRNGAPDVLITEVVMEGIDGFALRESLLAARPELRTIYVTGYDLSEYKDYIDGTPVFYKPVDPQEVLAILGPMSPARQSASITTSLPPEQRTQSARLRRLVDKQGFTSLNSSTSSRCVA